MNVYGAYGQNLSLQFNQEKISLLEREFILAFAHVRGGGELGKEWYNEGKHMQKMNSFTDFISCTKFLIDNKYTSPSLMTAIASSAGGLILGTVMNMRPDLYKAMILKYPFVDILTSMMDPSLPLTIHEYDEWGNPNNIDVFNYILSYDPYRNIKLQPYPHILVTASTIDPRVPYWQPVKWVAKLKVIKEQLKFDSNILLHTDQDSGHFGAGGAYNYLWQEAQIYCFLINSISRK